MRPLSLDVIVPVIMSCALLWWIGRRMNGTTRLVVTAITLVVIICILLFEHAGFEQPFTSSAAPGIP